MTNSRSTTMTNLQVGKELLLGVRLEVEKELLLGVRLEVEKELLLGVPATNPPGG
jgi:hypothetical protein